MKGKIRFSYESQVKFSLLFLILFLVLLNLGTLYLLGKTKMVLQKENQAKLKGASTTAGILWENGKTENLQNGLEQLAFAFNFEHILILDKNQKVLASSKSILEPEIESKFSGKNQSAITHKIPIFDPRTQNELFVMIRTKGDYLNALDKISKLDAIFRGAGVLLALFLGLVLINAILKPYRMMRKKAENVPIKPEKDGENVDFVVNVPVEFRRYLVPKGSVAVNGVSLTVAEKRESEFSVSLIPVTLAETTLGLKQSGDRVNLEADIIGKYVERFLMRPGATDHAEKPAGGVDMALLAKSGFI